MCIRDRTKPLGTGILATAARGGMFEAEFAGAAASMATLNRLAAETAQTFEVRACTDVTGFGLFGHLLEMAGDEISFRLDSRRLPLLAGAAEAAALGMVPAGAYSNRRHLSGRLSVGPGVGENVVDICCDPQTSGGLLFSLPAAQAGRLDSLLRARGLKSAVIGEVIKKHERTIYLD
ncbi:MAG: AIR synthase-related protein, partial [Negativicutes bacterium]|nr:AIR synthase-related protein [Negativicutes bacterium]